MTKSIIVKGFWKQPPKWLLESVAVEKYLFNYLLREGEWRPLLYSHQTEVINQLSFFIHRTPKESVFSLKRMHLKDFLQVWI